MVSEQQKKDNNLLSHLNFPEICNQFKTPLFIYDHDAIVSKIKMLKRNLPHDIKVYYAAKANPNKEILRSLVSYVDGLDISSVGELRQSLKVGYSPMQMSFAGPGKSDDELEYSIKHQLESLSVESVNELKRIEETAKRLGENAHFTVRVNPNDMQRKFAIKMGGRPSQFGVAEDSLDEFLACFANTTHCDLVGLHVYSGTQCLDENSLICNIENTLNIAKKIVGLCSEEIRKINFGGGFGIPYYEGQNTLNERVVCTALAERFHDFKKEINNPHVEGILELGRYLVGEAGYYITQVVDVKYSKKQLFCVLNGGMNHHLAASGNLGQIVRKNYRIVNLSRPDSGQKVEVNFVGPLCTTIDLMGDCVNTVKPEMGDYICFLNSGAYAYTASPLMFLSHPTPCEVLVQDSKARLIRESISCEAFD